jgi:hypothetical protein
VYIGQEVTTNLQKGNKSYDAGATHTSLRQRYAGISCGSFTDSAPNSIIKAAAIRVSVGIFSCRMIGSGEAKIIKSVMNPVLARA